MSYIKDVLFHTRGPLLSNRVEDVRQEATAAHLRSSDRLRNALKELITEHNAMRGLEDESDDA